MGRCAGLGLLAMECLLTAGAHCAACCRNFACPTTKGLASRGMCAWVRCQADGVASAAAAATRGAHMPWSHPHRRVPHCVPVERPVQWPRLLPVTAHRPGRQLHMHRRLDGCGMQPVTPPHRQLHRRRRHPRRVAVREQRRQHARPDGVRGWRLRAVLSSCGAGRGHRVGGGPACGLGVRHVLRADWLAVPHG